jgi:hypothetical protein
MNIMIRNVKRLYTQMRLTELAINNSNNKDNKNRNDCNSDYPIGSHPAAFMSIYTAFIRG